VNGKEKNGSNSIIESGIAIWPLNRSAVRIATPGGSDVEEKKNRAAIWGQTVTACWRSMIHFGPIWKRRLLRVATLDVESRVREKVPANRDGIVTEL